MCECAVRHFAAASNRRARVFGAVLCLSHTYYWLVNGCVLLLFIIIFGFGLNLSFVILSHGLACFFLFSLRTNSLAISHTPFRFIRVLRLFGLLNLLSSIFGPFSILDHNRNLFCACVPTPPIHPSSPTHQIHPLRRRTPSSTS